jgi:hypothetical protein
MFICHGQHSRAVYSGLGLDSRDDTLLMLSFGCAADATLYDRLTSMPSPFRAGDLELFDAGLCVILA